jgi:hypothetical protein
VGGRASGLARFGFFVTRAALLLQRRLTTSQMAAEVPLTVLSLFLFFGAIDSLFGDVASPTRAAASAMTLSSLSRIASRAVILQIPFGRRGPSDEYRSAR